MTTYKIGDVLTDQDGCSRVKMEKDTAGGWVRKADVQELLRKQREACAKAGRKATLRKLQTHYPPKKTQEPSIIAIVQSCMADEIQEAILNANAEVEL